MILFVFLKVVLVVWLRIGWSVGQSSSGENSQVMVVVRFVNDGVFEVMVVGLEGRVVDDIYEYLLSVDRYLLFYEVFKVQRN